MSCPHPDKPVKARGMCRNCYEIWREDAPASEKIRRAVYPTDDEIVALFQKYCRATLVARDIGVRRETLRDYLACRPELNARCEPFKRLPREVVAERDAHAKRMYRATHREERNASKRRWAANRSQEDVQKWNRVAATRRKLQTQPLSVEDALDTTAYKEILRLDPCVYCGCPAGTVDHIQAVNQGGNETWDNFAGACQSCNSSKRDKSLLTFLSWRLDNVAA